MADDAFKSWLSRTNPNKSNPSDRHPTVHLRRDQLDKQIEPPPPLDAKDSNLILLGDFVRQCCQLTRELFLKRYPQPFLVQRSTLTKPLLSETSYHTTHDSDSDHSSPSNFETSTVYFIKKKSELFSQMISVGRSRNNDIWINFPHISKFHAYFTLDINKQWFLIDSGSTNGTWLGENRLSANNPQTLTTSSEISFGAQLHFQFWDSSHMFKLVESVAAKLS